MTSTRSKDPRRFITPESFSVAPELIGLPLAAPFRRLLALLLDLVPVAVLARAGFTVFLAFASAVLAWRSLSRVRDPGQRRPFGAGVLRYVIAVVVFGFVINISGSLFGDGDDGRGTVASMMAPETFSDPDSMAAFVERVSGGFASIDVSDVLEDTTSAADSTLAPAQRDSLVFAWATAVASRDSATAERLRPAAASILAAERIERLEDQRRRLARRNEALEDANRDLRDEIERASRPPGMRAALLGWFDDLGIGFGWGAFYFTLFTAAGRGQTPGKRLMGIRVIRLDGKRMGWWYAFERFGGYFACLTTGLLGFAQILWDRNRQGLHDKIVETVVIRDARRRSRTR
ncbi:MAG: RDD family protein [Gemmatimonadetes bacterium]|nr:RDD family protein [Gemmatimonadota bacterium]